MEWQLLSQRYIACLLFVTHVRCELVREELEQATATLMVVMALFQAGRPAAFLWTFFALLVFSMMHFVLAGSTPPRMLSNLCNLCVSVACSPWLPTWEGNPWDNCTWPGSMSANETKAQPQTTQDWCGNPLGGWVASKLLPCTLHLERFIYMFASSSCDHKTSMQVHGNRSMRNFSG